MRKILIYSILSISLFACKKNDEKVAEAEAKEDSIAVEPSKTQADVAELKEFSPEQMAAFIHQKNPDTLYVTNFFATWCGPCMHEIPFFKKKMEELANKPVKFTFVSLDNKTDWATDVSDFADEYDIRNNVILLNGAVLNQDFFRQNFKAWDGGAIPFTLMVKGDQVDETVGSMSQGMLNQKIEKLLTYNASATVALKKERTAIAGPKKSLK